MPVRTNVVIEYGLTFFERPCLVWTFVVLPTGNVTA